MQNTVTKQFVSLFRETWKTFYITENQILLPSLELSNK